MGRASGSGTQRRPPFPPRNGPPPSGGPPLVVPSLRWTALTDGAVEPRRVHAGDAGYDLFVSESVVVEPRGYAEVRTGVAVEPPGTMFSMLVPRSSTLRVKGIHMMTGIIDSGYRGELTCGVLNVTDAPVEILAGERIGQLLLCRLYALPLEQVGVLGAGDRGGDGFGSTGR